MWTLILVITIFFSGMSPLHLAAWSGKVEVARLLVEAGANVNASSDNGDTPLILACQHGNSDVVRNNTITVYTVKSIYKSTDSMCMLLEQFFTWVLNGNCICFGFELLRSLRPAKPAALSQPVSSKTKTNHDLHACIFPCLMLVTYKYLVITEFEVRTVSFGPSFSPFFYVHGP